MATCQQCSRRTNAGRLCKQCAIDQRWEFHWKTVMNDLDTPDGDTDTPEEEERE